MQNEHVEVDMDGTGIYKGHVDRIVAELDLDDRLRDVLEQLFALVE